jgi:hypothetical protein
MVEDDKIILRQVSDRAVVASNDAKLHEAGRNANLQRLRGIMRGKSNRSRRCCQKSHHDSNATRESQHAA